MVTGTIDELLKGGEPIPSGATSTLERAQAVGFEGVYQAADNWCWAAAAASVANYHARRSNPTAVAILQCDIVKAAEVFGPRSCCNESNGPRYCSLEGQPDRRSPPSNKCFDPSYDRQYFLNRVLRKRALLERSIPMQSARNHCVMLETPDPCNPGALLLEQHSMGATLDFDEVKKLLDAGRLVCLRTVKNGSRHFIIIYGCEVYPDADFLIWDPDSGPEIIEADRLDHEYGPITHKIVTCRPEAPRC